MIGLKNIWNPLTTRIHVGDTNVPKWPSYLSSALCGWTRITATHIERFKLSRRNNGVKGATLNRDLRFLAQILKQAERERYLARSPFDLGKFFVNESRNRQKPYILSWEEQERLLAVASPRLRVLIVVGLETGMRTGEMLKLQWKEIGFLSNVLQMDAANRMQGLGLCQFRPSAKQSYCDGGI